MIEIVRENKLWEAIEIERAKQRQRESAHREADPCEIATNAKQERVELTYHTTRMNSTQSGGQN